MSVIIATRENGRDRSSVMVMYNVAYQKQPGLGTPLESKTCSCGGNLRELPRRDRGSHKLYF